MSATSVETGVSRRLIAAGSTGPEATGRHVVRVLPLSGETLQTMCSNVRFTRPADFWAALEQNLTNADATTGTVTYCFTEGKGESWTFESPTRWLNTETFGYTGPFRSEGLITNIRCAAASPSPRFMVVRVVGLGTAAQPIVYAPGLVNSTDRVYGASLLVESKFAEAVALAGKEWFEDGVDSEFSRTLSTLLHTYKNAALAPVEMFLGSPSTNVEVAVETAQWLGKVDHPDSRHYRRTLLEKILLSASSSVRLRHGAAAGLASMDDPSSLRAVVEARDREGNRRLRHFLQLVVDQLERTRACLSS